MQNSSMFLKKDDIDTIAIGSFDGAHIAHQQLISQLGNSGALVVIDKDEANLTPGTKRSEYSKRPCMYYHFLKIRYLSGEEFINLLQKDFPNLKRIVVGYDFHFGTKRANNIEDLKRFFKKEVLVIEEVKYDGISVHSSYIRELLREGKIKTANKFLGREYSLMGGIIKGQGIGAKELFATINIFVRNYLVPKDGVYATRVRVANEFYDSVTFIGNRLSTDRNFAIETHILNFNEQIKWRDLEIFFVERLRDNQAFDDLELLKAQIKIDIQRANKLLETCKIEHPIISH